MRLSTLFNQMSAEEREALAVAAGSDVAYLRQLAQRWRGKKASVDLMRRLSEADARLTLADLIEEFAEPVNEPTKEARA